MSDISCSVDSIFYFSVKFGDIFIYEASYLKSQGFDVGQRRKAPINECRKNRSQC